MAPGPWPQPMLVVRDVEASSRFYQQVLGTESGHGGSDYEQIVTDGYLVVLAGPSEYRRRA
ncbi:MAG TPA: hypothetical protein VLK36_05140 [Gaiellaceae bacterium]|nr:hypothetical protein [Gaiellaceae bacterium]